MITSHTTNTCRGKSEVHRSQTWGGRSSPSEVMHGPWTTAWCHPLPLLPALWAPSCGHALVPLICSWLQKQTLLRSFSRAHVKRPLQLQRERESLGDGRGGSGISVSKQTYVHILNQWRGLAWRNKYVPNPRNQAAEQVPQVRYTFNT